MVMVAGHGDGGGSPCVVGLDDGDGGGFADEAGCDDGDSGVVVVPTEVMVTVVDADGGGCVGSNGS